MKVVFTNNRKLKKEIETQEAIEWMRSVEARKSYKELKPRLDKLGISELEFMEAVKKGANNNGH